MNVKSRFELIYAPQVRIHLHAIERKYYSLIRRTIETQLQFDPDVETRNKKPLKRPAEWGADWEIRFGPDNHFRVFYTTDREHQSVNVLAIGMKKGDRLLIGGEEVSI
jgi:mRNA-degrading endonuclease RelE of RelBE toxin-antitoxin system